MANKYFKSIAAMLMICAIVFVMAGCSSKLNGKYTKSEGLIEQSFIFNNDGTVKVSAFDIEIEGEYEIKDGKITITYSLLGLSYDWVKDFDKKGNSIFIDGTEFVKDN